MKQDAGELDLTKKVAEVSGEPVALREDGRLNCVAVNVHGVPGTDSIHLHGVKIEAISHASVRLDVRPEIGNEENRISGDLTFFGVDITFERVDGALPPSPTRGSLQVLGVELGAVTTLHRPPRGGS